LVIEIGPIIRTMISNRRFKCISCR